MVDLMVPSWLSWWFIDDWCLIHGSRWLMIANWWWLDGYLMVDWWLIELIDVCRMNTWWFDGQVMADDSLMLPWCLVMVSCWRIRNSGWAARAKSRKRCLSAARSTGLQCLRQSTTGDAHVARLWSWYAATLQATARSNFSCQPSETNHHDYTIINHQPDPCHWYKSTIIAHN